MTTRYLGWRKAVIYDDKSLTKFSNPRPDLGLYNHIGRSLCARGVGIKTRQPGLQEWSPRRGGR
eukprot:6184646-Pleurochrysis_carterae.AAC.1